ncbi:cell wall protein PRY3-like isoform X2 [Maniola jurtina]|uniref:cell wall protein PRY3-like isoform X2 n=1 Tax=Maniola jurtina TaxID=191418 RepID=UPI001E6872CC|nr:cell wall protein PRY3-like isoform X2 [Maniola jurtina]
MLMINKIFVAFISCILWCWINFSQCEIMNKYCSLGFCNNSKQHIMCKFQSPSPAGDCLNYGKLISNRKEKQNVLDRINNRRNKVASGEIRSLPPAENMLKLEWSDELEVFAQRLADQCMSDVSRLTDWCHDLDNTSVGQAIGTIYGEAPGLTAPTLVDLWYMELLNINATYLPRYTPSSLTPLPHLDYFTQLIWAESSQVGCGGVKFKEINMDSNEKTNRTVYRLICNFAPSGNIIGQAVYNDGVPCSRCPYGGHCDSEYKYLCSSYLHTTVTKHNDNIQLTKEYKNNISNRVNFNNFAKVLTKEAKSTEITENYNLNENRNITTPDLIADNDTNFDILSHLFDVTSIHPSNLKPTTMSCKDVLAVDEFIELLKNKLNSDQSLKDLLISASNASTPDPSFTDITVAAIINQLYSKKVTTTISKSTHEENINSTLLADLVEAVIFRHSDKFSTTESTSLHSQIAPNVSPIKIQAELAEIQENTEFTGHYFFPEDEEKQPESTEIYDDLENSHISEISLEIDDLKKNRETKDFLEEILELDLVTESGIISDPLVLNNNNGTIIF